MSFTITVYPTPTVDAVADQVVCNGAMTEAITFTGAVEGTTFSWVNDNETLGLAAEGEGDIAAFTAINEGVAPVVATITVTPAANGCVGEPISFTITVNPTPMVDAVADQVVCNGAMTEAVAFTGAVEGTTDTWVNDNEAIGLAAEGEGDIAAFTAINEGTEAVLANITVTPSANGCTGAPVEFTITVNPAVVMDAVENMIV